MQLLKLAKSKDYIIKAGWIYARGMQGQYLQVKAGKAVSVQNQRPLCNSNCRYIDISPLQIFPGLKDFHIHLGLYSPLKRSEVLQSCLQAGILFLRDGGDRQGVILDNPRHPYPAIEAAGSGLFREGHYGDIIGIPTGPEGWEAAIESLASRRADWIKVILTGLNSFSFYGRVGKRQFDNRQLAAIVAVASRLNLPVMVHVNGAQAVKDALLAGVASIEHGYYLDREALRLMSEKKIYWVPTLAPLRRHLSVGKGAGKHVVQALINRQMHYISLAAAAGVQVAPGTDAAGWDNYLHWYRQELLLFKQAGICGMQLLTAASNNYFGLRLGAKVAAQGTSYHPLHAMEKLRPEIIIISE